MKISKHQKKVIDLMKKGYSIIFTQHRVSGSYRIHKDLPNGYIHSITLLANTFNSLRRNKIIVYDTSNKYGQKYYKLTGKNV